MPNGGQLDSMQTNVPEFVRRAHDVLHAPRAIHKVAAVVAAGGLMLTACSSYEADNTAGSEVPEVCAGDLTPVYEAHVAVSDAEAHVAVSDAKTAAGIAVDGSSEELRAQANLMDAEKAEETAKQAFMQPYNAKAEAAQGDVDKAEDGSSDKLRAQAKLMDAENAKQDAMEDMDNCLTPQKGQEEAPDTSMVAVAAAEELPKEDKWHIAGQGSCSPYTAANVEQAKRGELGTDKDLSDVEVEFLKQNPDFARNMALTSEQYGSGYIYEALGVQLPSANPETANESVVALFENEYYVTAPLAENTLIQNSYCDEQGNVHVYQQALLEADTYVGGAIVESETVADNGLRSVTLKNGKTINLPAQAIVANVKMADGSVVRMLAGNKAGVSTDGDFEAEFGCENWIISIPPAEQPPEVTPPTIPGQPTIPRNTTTTGPGEKHDDGIVPGPGSPGTAQPTPSGNPNTPPTNATTTAPATSSTTTATAPTTAPQNTTITAPAG